MNENWWNYRSGINLDTMTEAELDELIKAATEKRKTAKYRKVVDCIKQVQEAINATNDELNAMDDTPDVYLTLRDGTQVELFDVVSLTAEASNGTTICEINLD